MTKRVLLALALAAASSMSIAEDSAARTGIFVLVDVSETWLSPRSADSNLRALNRTFESVMDLLGRVDAPVAITVGTIGQDSLLQKPVCDAVYRRTLLSLSSTPGTFTHKERLRNHLELCAQAVLARPVAKWTDIQGALDAVARSADSGNYAQKFLFVLSDMKEEKPRGQGNAPIRLDGFNVALVYRILPEDSANPAGLSNRLLDWTQRLRSFGVTRAVQVLDTAQFAKDLPGKLLGGQP